MKKLARLFKLFVALSYVGFGLIVLVFQRNNYKPIYRGLRYFLEHESYQISMGKIFSDPATKELIDTRYRQYMPVPWDELKAMRPGSLGYEFAKFMNNPDVTPLEKLPEAKTEITPEIDYLRQRIRLVHDIHHVICGFPASEVGEVGISGFYVAQINSPLNCMVIAVGLIKCTLKLPHLMHEVLAIITEGWQQGLKAKNIFGVKWEEMWERSVHDIRKELNITPSIHDFVPPMAEHMSGLSTGFTLHYSSPDASESQTACQSV